MGHKWLKRDFNESDKLEMARLYLEDRRAVQDIAAQFGCSKRTIRSTVGPDNLRKTPTQFLVGKANARKYTLDEAFFDDINTEAKAYFLGLICADGWVPAKNEIVGLALTDPLPVYALKHAVNFSGEVKIKPPSGKGKKPVFELRMNSRKMVRRMREIGLGVNKTKSMSDKVLDVVPEDLLHHFIRGFWDGDGGVRITARGDLCVYFCGTEEFMQALVSRLAANVGVSQVKIRPNKPRTVWMIEYRGLICSMMLREFLFDKASIWLQRKKNKLFSLLPRHLGWLNAKQRITYDKIMKDANYPAAVAEPEDYTK
jgi:hypothetical protein